MHKTIDAIIKYLNSTLYYNASPCPFHRNKSCFTVHSNVNDEKHYHVLLDNGSEKWFPVKEGVFTSCDVPQFCHCLIKTHESLGDDLVLPFASWLRDPSGQTCVLFRTRGELYPPGVISERNLAEMYLGFVIFFCEVSFWCEGKVPDLKYMKFLYTETHPVLADVGKKNCLSSKTVRKDAKKTWSNVMRTGKLLPIVRYLSIVAPQCMVTKRKKGKTCYLLPHLRFSDYTHDLICKKNTMAPYQVLKHYILEGSRYKNAADAILSRMDESSNVRSIS
jgi:hypothetical protein